ncbi:hypothetical protein PV10_08515 [Exophiala mesophila]|uniref:Uncharacterized protein n=1 Tax=Exophiala mesophila TaxID=212818 RepID=A0A0D1Z265_EXOME|nr:uncharacterized protein PV10_08515 [Exophiala mesophila]KIV88882.1 hypothetical protein PV10_08515 [Exophiala mesophila]
MCIYYTYHWNCCPGTARPAPYYLHEMCDKATAPKPATRADRLLKKCKVVHEILDGAEAENPCPRCGYVVPTPHLTTIADMQILGPSLKTVIKYHHLTTIDELLLENSW